MHSTFLFQQFHSLARFVQVILTPELINAAHEAVERWAVLSHHPHLVCPRQALATKEVEDTASLVFAYEYHPGPPLSLNAQLCLPP